MPIFKKCNDKEHADLYTDLAPTKLVKETKLKVQKTGLEPFRLS